MTNMTTTSIFRHLELFFLLFVVFLCLEKKIVATSSSDFILFIFFFTLSFVFHFFPPCLTTTLHAKVLYEKDYDIQNKAKKYYCVPMTAAFCRRQPPPTLNYDNVFDKIFIIMEN